jgi:hypothetical protein
MSMGSLIRKNITDTSLKILVFGPQVKALSEDERTMHLQLKRIQIRKELESLGHHVRYAEELVDPDLPGDTNNAFLQELVIMPEYDLIVTLVCSPGSNAEATAIAMKPALAQKASLFVDYDHREGLVASVCSLAQQLGADYRTYQYPEDLVDCHLLGFVKDKIERVQIVKYLS